MPWAIRQEWHCLALEHLCSASLTQQGIRREMATQTSAFHASSCALPKWSFACCQSIICLSVCLSVCLFTYVCVSICLAFHLSFCTHLSLCTSTQPTISLYSYLYICSSVNNSPVPLPACSKLTVGSSYRIFASLPISLCCQCCLYLCLCLFEAPSGCLHQPPCLLGCAAQGLDVLAHSTCSGII